MKSSRCAPKTRASDAVMAGAWARDGLYRISGTPQVAAGSDLDRYVGSQGSLTVEWEVQRHLTLIGTYSHFFPGGFLQQSGVGNPVDFVGLWAAFWL